MPGEPGRDAAGRGLAGEDTLRSDEANMGDALLLQRQDATGRTGEAPLGAPATSAVPAGAERAAFRFYDVFMVAGATVAVCSNLLALKVVRVGPVTFGG